MLRKMLDITTSAYAWIAPKTTLTGKLRQMDRSSAPMEVCQGTVAECVIDRAADPPTITKHYKVAHKPRMLRELGLVKRMVNNYTVQSWAEEAANEFDAAHEFDLLKAFHDVWGTEGAIVVPAPLAHTEHSLCMQYVDWPRFVEYTGPDTQVWALLKTFFYESIRQGLLHGDLSKYNVLVHPDGRRICVIDFGLAKRLTPDEAHELLHDTRPAGIAHELHNAWTDPSFVITEAWWQTVLNSMDTAKGSRHSGLYARSLINLTTMWLDNRRRRHHHDGE
jgi:hypothetical protein